jgi:hypothetical protein
MKKGFDLEMKVAAQEIYVRGTAWIEIDDTHDWNDNEAPGISHKVNINDIYIETINDITPNYFGHNFVMLVRHEIKEQIEQNGVLL